ncbi:MAG: putative Se/S carrier-like protein [Blautia sp.]
MHLEALVMPVPRDLSSSCGTCVRFVAEGEFPEKNEEVEQIVRQVRKGEYICIFSCLEE